ncbi:EAL domain-containing protein [Tepidimonas taiwanensis]|uniref:Putative signaling protein n=1 Tax=Tepidimonas taiwanensis TaxID=307486 RepID=A0A554X6R1_9BURK|nr:EAL domain-containing protein [Tepidimonas taiwanensis]MCX7692053.1 EAL domain-containing protein [Tepidimonas taiwanensis]MDM7464450.1 EAL domain-containing protein [Tepidimonas taiwanensis]TSE31511.1 putative signaling protein [Tepidimonas taiwanensis]UBQ06246.1 EAL domain-containing protein [Tepidimonas taiwanensis]
MATAPRVPTATAPQQVRVPFRVLLQRRLLAGALTVILALTGLTAVGIVWPMAQHAAQHAFVSATREVDARLQADFGATRQALQVFAHALEANPPSVDAPEPFLHLAQHAIASMPLVTSIVAGNGRGQGWLLLWRPAQREWFVRLTDRARWGDVQHFMTLDDSGRVLRTWREPLAYDARERPWYRLAMATPGQVRWTEPYVFFTTREPGITAALAWRSPQGEPWAVGFDLRASEIDAMLKGLPLGPRGLAVMVDGAGQVFGRSDAPLTLSATATGAWRLPTAADTAPPVIRQALAQPGSEASEPARLGFPDAHWWVTRRAVMLGDRELSLWLAAPWWDFVPHLGRWLALLAGFALAVAIAALWAARRGAQQFARPLEYLARAAEAVGRLSFSRPVRTDWRTVEVQALAKAMNDMRRRLRIFQRRLQRREAQLQREVEALTAAEQRLLHVGLHDPLTDLPNRRLLLERIQHALARGARTGAPLAVLYVDLDHFKEVNDSWGHDVGDALLQQVAQRLRELVRGGDTVARLGGDEFALVLEDIDPATAQDRARAVVAALEQPFELGEHRTHISASVGLCLAPRDGRDAVTLLRHADEAMYRAKSTGRARVVVYEAGFSQATQEAREMREALAQAIADRSIALWWQPQVDLPSGRIVAAEGLLRWQHPRWGHVSPATFIPLAEDGGLMPRLGQLVLALAFEHGKRLEAAGWSLERLAINVSPLQLTGEAFADEVLRHLQASGWPASRLELEITESVLLDEDQARGGLQRLEAQGVRLAVDDFGTGYSSLAYLRRLPLDTLKIDGSFVRDIGTNPQADALVESLIQLGHAVGLELVAEGVETAAQRDFLAARGVRRGQGFLWSPARPVDDWVAHRVAPGAPVSS